MFASTPLPLAFPILLLSAMAAAQSTNFDTAAGAAGWLNVTLPYPAPGAPPVEIGSPAASTWLGSGGQPGGFVRALDPDGSNPTGNVQYWRAPASYLGNKAACLGGQLRYDTIALTSLATFPQEDLLLTGNGLTLAFYAGINPLPNVWTTITAPLTVGAWHIGDRNGPLATNAQIASVLSGLTSLYLRGEFQLGPDLMGLDNVALLPPAATIGYGAGCGAGSVPAPVLTALTQPALGGSYTLQSTAPASTVLGVFVHGSVAFVPGIDLSGLGMTGCSLFVSLDVLATAPIVGGLFQQTLAMPSDPALAGLHLFSQAGALAPLNPFGMVVSAAVDATVGS